MPENYSVFKIPEGVALTEADVYWELSAIAEEIERCRRKSLE